jgi:hypothetical protein
METLQTVIISLLVSAVCQGVAIHYWMKARKAYNAMRKENETLRKHNDDLLKINDRLTEEVKKLVEEKRTFYVSHN